MKQVQVPSRALQMVGQMRHDTVGVKTQVQVLRNKDRLLPRSPGGAESVQKVCSIACTIIVEFKLLSYTESLQMSLGGLADNCCRCDYLL